MVFLGCKLAVALRAKGGPNLMIQTHGINTRAVQDATSEVASTFKGFLSGQAGLDGSGDKAPGFGVGQLRVVQGRYSVSYRLVGSLYVMLVSEPQANVFLCLQLLDAVAKVLVGVVKGVDVTPDRLAKKYTEVYMLLDDLLCGGFSTLPPAFVHSSATDERLLVMPTSAADAARRFKKMMRGTGKSQFVPAKPGAGAEGDGVPPPVPETPTRVGKHLEPEEGDPLGEVAFDIPLDALPPPPPRAAAARAPPPRAAPAVTTVAPIAFKGAVQEDAAAQPVESEGFGAFAELGMLEAEKAAPAAAAAAAAAVLAAEAEAGWAQFGEEELPMPATQPAAPAAPQQPQPPAVSDKDVQDSLQLVEIWHGEVSGGQLTSAGVEGRVVRKLAPYGLPAACFQVQPSGSQTVDACLRVAAMNKQFTEKQQQAAAGEASSSSCFLATFQRASVGCAYLTYMLPAVACPPPLQLQLLVAPSSSSSSDNAWQGLVVLRYAASPHLAGSLLDVVVDLDLPGEAAGLARVSPAAQWAKEHGRLRWTISRMAPGSNGMLKAVITAKQGASAAAAAASLKRSTQARVRFSLRPGAALSGLGFKVSRPEAGAAFLPGTVQCYGEVTVSC